MMQKGGGTPRFGLWDDIKRSNMHPTALGGKK